MRDGATLATRGISTDVVNRGAGFCGCFRVRRHSGVDCHGPISIAHGQGDLLTWGHDEEGVGDRWLRCFLGHRPWVLGQGLLLGNVTLLEYGGLVWLLFHLFVLVYEEPTLRASFGSEYGSFCAEVPRWIPRFTAWRSHPEA